MPKEFPWQFSRILRNRAPGAQGHAMEPWSTAICLGEPRAHKKFGSVCAKCVTIFLASLCLSNSSKSETTAIFLMPHTVQAIEKTKTNNFFITFQSNRPTNVSTTIMHDAACKSFLYLDEFIRGDTSTYAPTTIYRAHLSANKSSNYQ